MKYAWTAKSDDGCFEDMSEKAFDTQEECYTDMMVHAVNKIKWNVDYWDVIDGQNILEKNGIKQTNEVGKDAGYIGYELKFMPHKIVHTSYSGTYTYEIVTKEDEDKKEDNPEQNVKHEAPKYTLKDEVEYDGTIFLVVDFRYDGDAAGWVYDLRELEGDGVMLDIPQDEIAVYIEDIPESIIAEYSINGSPRMYVYNLSDINDCEHYFDDEDKLVRTLVKTDKGMSEEDYYRDMPIHDVTKMVLAAERKLRQTI